jgi:energy-coupling factor transport system substrate-specific component
LVVAAALAVALGVVFWAWGLLYSTVFEAIPFPFSYAFVGMWMTGALLVPYIIRRPGAALFGELVASFVSMAMGNQWGIMTLASGLVQGLGAEVVFGVGRWKRFSGVWLYGAAAMAGLFSIILDVFVESYWAVYSWSAIGVAAGLCIVGSMVLGGGVSQVLGVALERTGVLSGLAISNRKAKRI